MKRLFATALSVVMIGNGCSTLPPLPEGSSHAAFVAGNIQHAFKIQSFSRKERLMLLMAGISALQAYERATGSAGTRLQVAMAAADERAREAFPEVLGSNTLGAYLLQKFQFQDMTPSDGLAGLVRYMLDAYGGETSPDVQLELDLGYSSSSPPSE